MTRTTSLLAMAALFCLGDAAPAAEGCGASLKSQLCCARCATMPCCCPDDYCRKPMPCIPCLPRCGCADDYCRKPMPCIPCLPRCGCADDYCRKPMPCLCWPVQRQFYRCPPPECGRP